MDRPSTPVFVPEEPKVDQHTQIHRLDQELFSFEQQVEPVLEILVAKSINQAQIEIFEEDRAQLISEKTKSISVKQRVNSLDVQKQVYRRNRYKREESKRRRQRTNFYRAKLEVHKKLYTRQYIKDKTTKGLFSNIMSHLFSKRIVGERQSLQMEAFYRDRVIRRGRDLLNEDQDRRELFAKMLREAGARLTSLHSKTIQKVKTDAIEREQKALEKKILEERQKEEQRRKDEEKNYQTKIGNLGKTLIQNLKAKMTRENLRELKHVQNRSIWKKRALSDTPSQCDVFGLGLNSLILLSLRAIHEEKKIASMRKENQVDSETKIDTEFEVGRKILGGVENLSEKWPKMFPQFRFELPISMSVARFFENYERALWTYLGLKEMVVNSKWPLKSPKIDLDRLENEILGHAGPSDADSEKEAFSAVGLEHFVEFLSSLDNSRRKELILSYFFNTDNKKTILLSDSRVKVLIENISRSDDFCKSNRLSNMLHKQTNSDGLGVVEQFLVDEHILTPNMWVQVVQNVFRIRIGLLKKQFQSKIKQYKQELKARNNQIPKDSKGGSFVL